MSEGTAGSADTASPAGFGHHLPPLIADVGAVAGYFLAVGALSTQLEKEAAVNAGILGGAYLVLCVSVFLLRKTGTQDTRQSEGWTYALFALALAFGVYVLAMGAETSGLMGVLEGMDSSMESARDNALLLVGSVAAFGLLLLYPLMFIVPTGTSIRAGSRGRLAETVALLGVNLAIVVSVAQWEALFADVEPYDSINAATKILIFVPTLAFFLLFYGSPRLLFLLRDHSRFAVGTFVVESGVVTWAALERTAW